MRRRLLLAGVVAALVAGCGGGTTGTVQTAAPGSDAAAPTSSAPTASSAPAAKGDAKVGQAIRVQGSGKDAAVTVLGVKTYTTGKTDTAEAPTNGTFIVADVLITVTTGRYEVNPLYFKYQAPDGTTTDPLGGNAGLSGYEPALQAGDIGPGQRTRAFVTFDGKWGKGCKVQLTDPLSAVIGQWAL